MKRIQSACLLCERTAVRHAFQQRRISQFSRAATRQIAAVTSRAPTTQPPLQFKRSAASAAISINQNRPVKHAAAPSRPKPRVSTRESAAALEQAKELGSKILSSKDEVPSEEETLQAIKACEIAARRLTGYEETPGVAQRANKRGSTPASALLALDSRPTHHVSLAIPIDFLSNLCQEIMLHPTVFITPPILKSYVVTQSILQRPQSFPKMFRLYASKPIPRPGSTPPTYATPAPNSQKAAVPAETANLALSCAIQVKDLDLAFEIVNTTFRTRAFHRRKFITRALGPLTGMAMTPVALWVLATKVVALGPTAMAPQDLQLAVFFGGMTYVAVVASMGFIALTTANDQMERVTWAPGTPLRERWIREEERAAMDNIAQAWGFSETWRRGEEEGEDWEYLKEWVGERGCIVDKVELMEGME